MAMPTNEVLRDYTLALTKIHARLLAARRTLAEDSGARSIESAALDLRFALEEMLLSALVTHKADLGEITKSLRSANASQARKSVERINPNWWPKPQDISPGGPGGVQATVSGHHDTDYMTADEWGRAYGTVSDLLHARNPFKAPGYGAHAMRDQLQEISDSVWRLLKAHTLDTGSPGYLLLGRFDETQTQVGALTKVSDV
jgi:hypothetical protein